MASFITARQLSERWGCSPQHVRRLCAAGSLRAMRLGLDASRDAWRISEEAIAEYELAHTSHPAVKQPDRAPSRLSPPGPTGTAAILGPLPDGYEPRFPEAWGLPSRTTGAVSSAAGRGRSTGKKKTAPVRG